MCRLAGVIAGLLGAGMGKSAGADKSMGVGTGQKAGTGTIKPRDLRVRFVGPDFEDADRIVTRDIIIGGVPRAFSVMKAILSIPVELQ